MNPMNRNLVTFGVAVFFVVGGFLAPLGILAQHSHTKKEKQVSLEGEIVDLQCFLVHPDYSTGESHAKCAKVCINKGLPVGLLTEDENLYLLLGPGHDSLKAQVADLAGKKVTVVGTLIEGKTIKAVQVRTIE